MSQDQQKRLAAEAALDFIESGEIVGVGHRVDYQLLLSTLWQPSKGKLTVSSPVQQHLLTGSRQSGCRYWILTGPETCRCMSMAQMKRQPICS